MRNLFKRAFRSLLPVFCSWLAKLRKLLRSASECHTFGLLSFLLSTLSGIWSRLSGVWPMMLSSALSSRCINRNTTFWLFHGNRFWISDNYDIGQDPREEVMTLERVLLQTIKFDLQVSSFTCHDLLQWCLNRWIILIPLYWNTPSA